MCEALSDAHLAAFKVALAVSLELTEAEANKLVEAWEPVVLYQAFKPTVGGPLGYLILGVKLQPVGLPLGSITGTFSEEHDLWRIRMMVYSNGTARIVK